jgi:hypothetical protein
MRLSRIAGHAGALALLAAMACSSSSSSSIPKGNLEIEGGPADAAADVTSGDDAEPVDGSADSTEPGDDSSPPSDAAPVDAAFACAHASTVADCGYCLTEVACIDCAAMVAPQFAQEFKPLIQCLECTACYTACGGSDKGCSGPPAMPDPCDKASPSQAGCEACQGCAVAGSSAEASVGSCNGQSMVCQADHGCEQILSSVAAACSHLP